MGPITLAKADQLFWLGRYSERVFTTLNRFFTVYDANVGIQTKDFSDFCQRIGICPGCGTAAEDILAQILYDPANPSSVCSSMRAAFGNAIHLRADLGTTTTSHIELALINLRGSKDPVTRLPLHRNVHDNLLAFWGAVEDGAGAEEAKAILFFGKYVERLSLWSRFGATEEELDPPLRKLIFYLGFIRHPERLSIPSILDSLSSELTARNYGANLTSRIDSCARLIRHTARGEEEPLDLDAYDELHVRQVAAAQ